MQARQGNFTSGADYVVIKWSGTLPGEWGVDISHRRGTGSYISPQLPLLCLSGMNQSLMCDVWSPGEADRGSEQVSSIIRSKLLPIPLLLVERYSSDFQFDFLISFSLSGTLLSAVGDSSNPPFLLICRCGRPAVCLQNDDPMKLAFCGVPSGPLGLASQYAESGPRAILHAASCL